MYKMWLGRSEFRASGSGYSLSQLVTRNYSCMVLEKINLMSPVKMKSKKTLPDTGHISFAGQFHFTIRWLRSFRSGRVRIRDRLEESLSEQPTKLVAEHFQQALETTELNIKSDNHSRENLLEGKDKKVASFSDEASDQTFSQKVKAMKVEIGLEEVTQENQYRLLHDTLNIFHNLPYEKQLEWKDNKTRELLQTLRRMSSKKGVRLKGCNLPPIIGSPVLERYRTQDELSLYRNLSGDPTVGYFVRSRSSGTVCVEPLLLTTIRQGHINLADIYQKFVRHHALAPNLVTGRRAGGQPGHWGNIAVRSNRKGEAMLMVNFHTLKLTSEDVEAAKNDLVTFFRESSSDVLSIYMATLPTTGLTEGRSKPCLLFGPKYLEEEFCDLTLNLDPESAFPVNLESEESLLDAILAIVGRKSHYKTLLSVFCGAGFLTLNLATHFRGCVALGGEDSFLARHNSSKSGIHNCRFVAGKVDSTLQTVAKDLLQAGGSELVALVAPYEGGLDQRALHRLLELPLLDTIIYLSTQPLDGQVSSNFADIIVGGVVKKTDCRRPFGLVEVQALDIGPHTHHCLHMLVFKRSGSY